MTNGNVAIKSENKLIFLVNIFDLLIDFSVADKIKKNEGKENE
jgi:hypothetical protein